jgi:hypothetical protein
MAKVLSEKPGFLYQFVKDMKEFYPPKLPLSNGLRYGRGPETGFFEKTRFLKVERKRLISSTARKFLTAGLDVLPVLKQRGF